ncbi:UNKNOWN [Stylonychia lemnae]|uniref:Uncharacterized protein n=1 Tax=Stylonychia lemnae TaxID=5949 RepID=A0A078ASW1_STYLE|nr:UNKNOWN [Stylonychia lemnae]|eukprot:CDW85111.1 UNKNOWN [Stylonychia lemnae]
MIITKKFTKIANKQTGNRINKQANIEPKFGITFLVPQRGQDVSVNQKRLSLMNPPPSGMTLKLDISTRKLKNVWQFEGIITLSRFILIIN